MTEPGTFYISSTTHLGESDRTEEVAAPEKGCKQGSGSGAGSSTQLSPDAWLAEAVSPPLEQGGHLSRAQVPPAFRGRGELGSPGSRCLG